MKPERGNRALYSSFIASYYLLTASSFKVDLIKITGIPASNLSSHWLQRPSRAEPEEVLHSTYIATEK